MEWAWWLLVPLGLALGSILGALITRFIVWVSRSAVWPIRAWFRVLDRVSGEDKRRVAREAEDAAWHEKMRGL